MPSGTPLEAESSSPLEQVIHTKARSRLYTRTVQLLLYSYINLRLINKCTKEMGDFLTQTLEGCDDDGLLEAGESPVEEPEDEVVDLTE